MPLPGAKAEGVEVADLFESYNALIGGENHIEVVRLFGPREATRTNVLSQVMQRSFDVLHFAGHCTYEPDNPPASRWIFTGGQRLSARELGRVDRIPRFVFSNACESGVTPERAGDRAARPFVCRVVFRARRRQLHLHRLARGRHRRASLPCVCMPPCSAWASPTPTTIRQPAARMARSPFMPPCARRVAPSPAPSTANGHGALISTTATPIYPFSTRARTARRGKRRTKNQKRAPKEKAQPADRDVFARCNCVFGIGFILGMRLMPSRSAGLQTASSLLSDAVTPPRPEFSL